MSGIISRSVLAGVDGSAESLAALGLAASEAQRRGTRLTVIHVWAGPAWRPGRPAARPSARPDAERLLAAATVWLRAHHPHVPVTGRLVLGDPVEVLEAGSVTAQRVVVGRRGTGAATSAWGTVAAQLSRRSRAPVILGGVAAPAQAPGTDAPVIVVIPAATAGPTLWFAFDEAARYGAPLVPCHVGAASGPFGGGALAEWSARYPAVEVHPRALRGPEVARALAVAAREARLLVVGAGPDRTLTDTLRAPVPCPVAVVPERAATTGLAAAAVPAAEPVRAGR
jgi:nucleotide-binding universal stress UspA family protein